MLHFAPEKVIYDKFSSLSNVDYYPVDINPSAKHLAGLKIRDAVDIQHIQYPDGMFDAVICSHILEHIPDDLKAMRELRRVLKKGSFAYIMCPIGNFDTTRENPEHNTPELRKEHYGQSDHVRHYGRDFSQRLTDSGFSVEIIEPNKVLANQELHWYGLSRSEIIFKCKEPEAIKD